MQKTNINKTWVWSNTTQVRGKSRGKFGRTARAGEGLNRCTGNTAHCPGRTKEAGFSQPPSQQVAHLLSKHKTITAEVFHLQQDSLRSILQWPVPLLNQSRALNVFCHQESEASLESSNLRKPGASLSYCFPCRRQASSCPFQREICVLSLKNQNRYEYFAFCLNIITLFLADSSHPPSAGQMLVDNKVRREKGK